MASLRSGLQLPILVVIAVLGSSPWTFFSHSNEPCKNYNMYLTQSREGSQHED